MLQPFHWLEFLWTGMPGSWQEQPTHQHGHRFTSFVLVMLVVLFHPHQP